MSAPLPNDTTYPYDAWDTHFEFEPTPTIRALNIAIAIVSYPSIFINLAITYSYCTKPEWRRRSGYLVLVVQNTYDLLYLIARFVPSTFEAIGNTSFPALAYPTNIACFLGIVSDIAWYEHVVAHLMVAGNRFVAVVFYAQYKRWFTVRNTATYILLFFLVPIVRQVIMSGVIGTKTCHLNFGGMAILYSSLQASEIYGIVDIVITATSIGLATILNITTIYRLRKLTKASHLEVQPAAQEGQPAAQEVQPAAQEVQAEESATKPDKKERRLAIHFLVVTAAFMGSWIHWLLAFFAQIEIKNITQIIDIINYTINGYAIIIVSKDIRKGVFNRNKC